MISVILIKQYMMSIKVTEMKILNQKMIYFRIINRYLHIFLNKFQKNKNTQNTIKSKTSTCATFRPNIYRIVKRTIFQKTNSKRTIHQRAPLLISRRLINERLGGHIAARDDKWPPSTVAALRLLRRHLLVPLSSVDNMVVCYCRHFWLSWCPKVEELIGGVLSRIGWF